MNVGSLFSGIGGFDLGLERAGMSVSWQVENNVYCRKVLAKHWPTVPCYGDIKTVKWEEVEPVDLVCGGFPCQPFSLAGKRRGKDDDRYLWPEVVRCLDVLRPTWFLGENVPGIINLALDQVCADLEGLGYEVVTFNIPACAVDAPHIRQRIWILAYTESKQKRGAFSAHGSHQVNKGQTDETPSARRRAMLPRGKRWCPEPSICRVDDGVSPNVDRLEVLGNAVVPQIVEALGKIIIRINTKGGPHERIV